MKNLDIIVKRDDFERAPEQVSNIVTSVMNRSVQHTSMSVSRLVKERYGISVDWHIVGYILDNEHSRGFLKTCGLNNDGMTIYYRD